MSKMFLYRGAGGSFGKKEKAIEDQYFHNLVSANSFVHLSLAVSACHNAKIFWL